MRSIGFFVVLMAFLALPVAGRGQAVNPPFASRGPTGGSEAERATQASCASRTSARLTAVADEREHTTGVDFLATSGNFDAVPLLTATVTVEGTTPSCLVAHFSVMPMANGVQTDEYVIFQVTVDDVPMRGHFPTPFLTSTPAVGVTPDFDTEMSAYNFFMEVTPGPHRIEVKFAGCCTGGGATVLAPVLTLEHR